MIHSLKAWPEPFEALWDGRKTFEFRWNDRDYKLGDVLHIREWNPDAVSYTGREVTATVSYILHAGQFGVPPGYAIMSLTVGAVRCQVNPLGGKMAL